MNGNETDTLVFTAIVNSGQILSSNAIISVNELESTLVNNEDQICLSIPVEICDNSCSSISITAAATTYQCYKDDVLISGANSQTFLINQEGNYHYVIDNDTSQCGYSLCCPIIVTTKFCEPKCMRIQIQKM